MVLFYTNSTTHLAKKIKMRKGRFTLGRFNDGEIFVKIQEPVKGKKVWLLANIHPPADSLLELIFMLDALKRAGARIRLLIPYFGYARQDTIKKGECFSPKIISDIISSFKSDKIIIINIHSPRLKSFLPYKDRIPFEMIYPLTRKVDVVLAPDKGALDLAQKISHDCVIELSCMEKVRYSKERVKIVKTLGSAVKGKTVLILDDIISTGNTLIQASRNLERKGAKEVYAFSTHGILSKEAIQKIERSFIKKVYITNTLPPPRLKSRKIKVLNIAPLLEELMKKDA